MTARRNRHRVKARSCAMFVMIGMAAIGCGAGGSDQLLSELISSDVTLRRAAARRLGEVVPPGEGTSGALIAALDDPDEEVRRWSAQGLGAIGAISSQYALEAKLKDTAPSVRRAAAFALQKLAPDSTAYRAELISAIKSGDGGVVVALDRLKPPPQWAVPVLLDVLKDRRPGLRRLSAEALGKLAAADPAVRTALEKAGKGDSDDRVREAANHALAFKRGS
jgi:HEAT repeat protein